MSRPERVTIPERRETERPAPRMFAHWDWGALHGVRLGEASQLSSAD